MYQYIDRVRVYVEEFEGEVWKPIEFNEIYEVSNMGRVRRRENDVECRLLSPGDDAHGYLSIALMGKDKKRKEFKVHRLVAICFVENDCGGEEVEHINGDKKDNRAENLEWITKSERFMRRRKNGERGGHEPGLRKNDRGRFVAKDHAGERIWYYTVKEKTDKKGPDGSTIWSAICDCGNEFEISASRMRAQKSCGCRSRRNDGSKEAKNLKGFEAKGFVVVDKMGKRDNIGNVIWKTRCLYCGEEKEYTGSRIVRGDVRCGCGEWKKRFPTRTGRPPMPNQQSRKNIYYGHYKKAAKERNLEFSLSKSEFEEIIQKPCFYCGAVPRPVFTSANCGGEELVANGVDRVDNEKGYSWENCVPCCKTCNFMKSDMSVGEFLDHVKKIAQWFGGGEG